MLLLKNATIVTGDGETLIPGGAVVVEHGRIVEVLRRAPAPSRRGDTVMDLGGRLLVPGAINSHAHGSIPGPLFASGAPALPFERVLANLDYHLRGGTTTVLSFDGFNVPEEIERSRCAHPRASTVSTSCARTAASRSVRSSAAWWPRNGRPDARSRGWKPTARPA